MILTVFTTTRNRGKTDRLGGTTVTSHWYFCCVTHSQPSQPTVVHNLKVPIQHLEEGLLSENQCGFRSECGTADMIFAERQLREKCKRQNSHHFVTSGIQVSYRTEGGLLNLRRLKDVIKRKVTETVIRDFLFAADCMKWTAYLKAVTTSALPTAPKNEVMYQTAPGRLQFGSD